MVNLGSLDCQEPRVEMADQGLLDQRDLRGIKVIQDQMDPLVLLGMMESMEKEDLLDQRERKESLVFKVAQGQEDPPALRVQRVILVLLASQATLVNKDLVE